MPLLIFGKVWVEGRTRTMFICPDGTCWTISDNGLLVEYKGTAAFFKLKSSIQHSDR